MDARTPRGVWVPAAFFALSGVLEMALAVHDTRPLAFWPLWDAFFRGVLHFLLAWGLWRRIALARSVAIVYCLAILILYAAVLLLAAIQAPVRFPDSVKLQSLVQVPSCALLLPFLRSARASALFPRPLFSGREHRF
jgi:hypothetical protein